jgi:PAS domain-containing protein
VLDFDDQMDSLRRRIDALRDEPADRSQSRTSGDVELVTDLEVAYEELRVADEELRTQHDEIAQLLRGHDLIRRQHERTLAALPVPAIITDGDGVMRAVNAAAAVLCKVPEARLVGKPIYAFLSVDDRRPLRTALSSTGPDVDVVRRQTTLLPRRADPVPVELSVAVRRETDGLEATWIFLRSEAPVEQPLAGMAQAFSALAAIPARAGDTAEVLTQVADVCSDTLGEGFELSVNLGFPLDPTAVTSTGPVAQKMDGAQMQTGEGPAVTAFEQRTATWSAEVVADPRWPRLRALVPDGVTGCVAVPLEIVDRPAGTMTVYGVPAQVTRSACEGVELLGATIGAVLYEVELTEELTRLNVDMERALSSRGTIEQAKGIIMSQLGCSADQAFSHLVRLSSSQERRLRDVARAIVEGTARS